MVHVQYICMHGDVTRFLREQIDKQIDKSQTNRQIKALRDRQIHTCMPGNVTRLLREQIDKQIDKYIDKYIDKQIVLQLGCINRQIHRQYCKNRQTNIQINRQINRQGLATILRMYAWRCNEADILKSLLHGGFIQEMYAGTDFSECTDVRQNNRPWLPQFYVDLLGVFPWQYVDCFGRQ